MDAKVTLSFDKEVARKAKEYAASQNISLSRLVEFLLHKTTTGQYSSLEDFSDCGLGKTSIGKAEYRTRKGRKDLKDEFCRKDPEKNESLRRRQYPGIRQSIKTARFLFTARILSLAGTQGYASFTSPICLAIAFYFLRKKGTDPPRPKKSDPGTFSAFADPSVKDLEDGLEYYSALEAGCDSILTEDKKGFYYSKIEVLTALEFHDKYMVPKRS